MSLEIVDEDWEFDFETAESPEFPTEDGPDQDISLLLINFQQNWLFNLQMTLPGDFPSSAGEDQDIFNHLVQKDLGWAFHIDAETAQWVIMWKRFVEYMEKIKGLLHYAKIQTPSKGKIKLKIRKRD